MLKCFLDSLDFDFGVIGISKTRILNSSIPDNLNLLNYTPFFTKTEAKNLLIGISDHLLQYLIFEQNTYACTSKPIQYRDWKKFDKDRFT